MKKNRRWMWTRIERKIETWRHQPSVNEFELQHFLKQNKAMLASFHLLEEERVIDQFLLFLDEEREKWWTEEEWLPLLRQVQEELTVGTNPEDGTSFPSMDSQPVLLIIDDDMEFNTYIKTYLEKNGYQVLVAITGRKGLELFYDMNPDLVLLDYILPDIDGISLLTQIVEKARHEFTPVMMVSAHVSDEHKQLSYNLGVWDFIGKPINKEIFLPFLNNRLEHSRRILTQTLQDELTGAFNRKFLDREFVEQLKRCEEEKGYYFSLAMVDLDHFKSVNDTYGHHMGDQVLETFVHVFEQEKDAEDTIIRYGGEEFAILFPGKDTEEAEKTIQQWREAFSSLSFTSGKEEFSVHFSAGLTQSYDSCHSRELMEQADKALYHSKHSGRNRTSFYSSLLAHIEPEEELHILIVDEDPGVRHQLTTYFSSRSYISEKPVQARAFGSEKELLETGWYDPEHDYILLLNVKAESGQETIASIRHAHPSANMAITILTEEGDPEEMEKALQADVDDYITKPFHVEEIGRRFEILVKRMFS